MKDVSTIKDLFASGNDVFIVAEIGKNFIQTKEDRPQEEYLENAKQLVKAAKDAGADAVKFQTHTVEDEQLDVPVVSPHFDGSDRYAWIQRNTSAAPIEFWREVKRCCDELGIIFFSTPMSRGAAELLNSVVVPLWKVASSDILDFVLLDYLAHTRKPVIISSGMSTEDEVDRAARFLRARGVEFAIMHCVSKYPCPPSELYLDTIPYLAERYGVPVGFSDHSLGYEAAVTAVGKGARVIEKHFSLNRSFFGPDHKVSVEPAGFTEMVNAIRSVASVDSRKFRSGVKTLDEEESAFRPVFRKSLMAGQDISAGTVITRETLYAMRPQQCAGGLPSEAYENVLGKRTTKDLRKYDPITEDILQP